MAKDKSVTWFGHLRAVYADGAIGEEVDVHFVLHDAYPKGTAGLTNKPQYFGEKPSTGLTEKLWLTWTDRTGRVECEFVFQKEPEHRLVYAIEFHLNEAVQFGANCFVLRQDRRSIYSNFSSGWSSEQWGGHESKASWLNPLGRLLVPKPLPQSETTLEVFATKPVTKEQLVSCLNEFVELAPSQELAALFRDVGEKIRSGAIMPQGLVQSESTPSALPPVTAEPEADLLPSVEEYLAHAPLKRQEGYSGKL